MVVTIRSRSSRNGSKTHFTGHEALLIQSKPIRSVLGGLVKSYAVGYGLNEIA